jgi:hypothetical protein
MTAADLQTVAGAVLRLAEERQYVAPRDIRGELSRAGLDEARWKEVVELLRESLRYRQGRYYFLAAASPRLNQEQQQQRDVRDVLRDILQQQTPTTRAETRAERRQEERSPFTRPVTLFTEDQQELTVLSQDISPTGIRLIANRSLLGRKLRVVLPGTEVGQATVTLVVRILWTTAVADGLFENGGTFLELLSGTSNPGAPAPPASR